MQEKHFGDMKSSLKPKSAMTKILALSDVVFKITVINMFKAPDENVYDMQAQMDNVNKEIETQNQKK